MAHMDYSLRGKVAFVTGGGGGIGAGIVLAMARHGADIAVLDIVPERAENVSKQVKALGVRAMPLVADVMNTDQLRLAIGAADNYFGRIDILVNNAGGVNGRPFLKQSERSWRRHIDINLVSMLAATSDVAKIMIRENRGGAIINVASIEGQRAAPYYAVYAACKAGMLSFTRSMALEFSSHNIRVNAIAPDHTVTPGNRGNRTGPVNESAWIQPTPEQQDSMNRLIPLGREGHVDECGNAAVFLASKMSEYVTGITLNVDGGTWASSGWVRDPEGRWVQNQGRILVDDVT